MNANTSHTQDLQAKFNLSEEDAQDVLEWLNGTGDEIDDRLYDKFYEHYTLNGEMPYGTAKARDGDPYEWILEKLNSEFGL